MYIWGGHYQRKYLNDLCAFNVKDCMNLLLLYHSFFFVLLLTTLFVVVVDPTKAEWEFISYENQGPSPRSGHVSVIHENKLYM